MRAAVATVLLLCGLSQISCREKPELGPLFEDKIVALSFSTPADAGNDPPGSTVATVTPGLKCVGPYDTYDVGIVNNTGSLDTDALIHIITEHNIDVVQRTDRKDYAIAGPYDSEGPCYTRRTH